MPKKPDLEKETKFINYFCEGTTQGNATQSAIKAGYNKETNPAQMGAYLRKKLSTEIRKKNEEIDRIKLIKSDNLTPRRRLQYLEKWDQDIFKELVGLIGYLIIGVCFGIYCIYNFFVLQLK